MPTKKYLSKDAAHALICKYCAYRERAHSEVRYKLIEKGIYGDDLEEIISSLISDNYLNEGRYARAFVRGKFRIKKWGRKKILSVLKQKHVSDYSIRKGMEEIDGHEYQETIKKLIKKKMKFIDEGDSFKRKGKVAKYMVGKGYEGELVWGVLEEW